MADDGSYFLDDFLFALKSAIYRSNQKSWRHHIENLRSYFHTNDKGQWEPRTVEMLLPSVQLDEDAGEHIEPHEIPVASLVDHRAMSMSRLNLEFECYLDGLETRKDTDPLDGVNLEEEYLAVTLVLTGGNRRLPKAKVSIEYKNEQSAEGVARINDALLKYF